MAWIKLWNRKHTLQQDFFGRFLWFTDNPYYCIKNMLMVGLPNNKADTYFNNNEWQLLMKSLAKEIFKDKKYHYNNYRKFLIHKKKFIKTAELVSQPLILKKLSNKELLGRYSNLKKEYLRYTYFFWIPWAINEIIVPYFEKELRNKFPEDHLFIYESVINPTRLTMMELNLISLSRFKKNIPSTHIKKYSFLNVYSLLDKSYSKSDFEQLRQITRSRNWIDPRKFINKNRLNWQKALSYLKFYPNLHRFAQVINLYAWLRTERVDVWRKVLLLTQPFYRELEKRMELNKNQASHLTYEEVINFLENKAMPDKKSVRCQELLYLKNGCYRVLRKGEEIKKILRRELKKSNREETLIRGVTACRGHAQGRVRIILTPKDCQKLKKGEILVSNMTHPDYILAIRKAAGIVTDEGGVSSHAAIISRELMIPCVVGTKIATDVFKDGDLVEVDANKGIVRKL